MKLALLFLSMYECIGNMDNGLDLSIAGKRDAKRLHSEVSPSTPLLPMTAAELRALLHETVEEELNPLYTCLDGIEQSRNAKQTTVDVLRSDVTTLRAELGFELASARKSAI